MKVARLKKNIHDVNLEFRLYPPLFQIQQRLMGDVCTRVLVTLEVRGVILLPTKCNQLLCYSSLGEKQNYGKACNLHWTMLRHLILTPNVSRHQI